MRGVSTWWLPITLLSAIGLAVGGWFLLHRPPRSPLSVAPVSNEYVDSRLCIGCHTKLDHDFRLSGMGRSFYRPSPRNTVEDYTGQNRFYHRPSGTWYAMSQRDGRYYQRRWQIGYDGGETNVEELQIDYVMGSGNHVRTYLHRTTRGTLVELPLAWYRQGGWAMNPGYDTDHFVRPRQIVYECMFCHNAYPRIPAGNTAPGAEPVYTGLPEGIDCQRCHGPGSEHVRAAQVPGSRVENVRRAIVNPARLNVERQLEVCMQCHLQTTSVPLPGSIRRFDFGPFSYRAGDPLGNFAIFFDRATGDNGDRFEIVSSAYRLRQSRCFAQSAGRLTCLTCHSIHNPEGARAAGPAKSYDRACRSCHTALFDELVSSGRHTAQTGCAACHMPKRRAGDVVLAVMTDHLIQRGPRPNLLAPLTERHETDATAYHGEVAAYYPQGVLPGDESALYAAVAQVKQKSNLTQGIARLTEEIDRQKPRHEGFYIELGEAWHNAGDAQKAAQAYADAAWRGSGNASTLRRLGVMRKEAGDRARALQVMQQAVEAAPDDARSWYELGLLHADMGKRTEGLAALRKAVALDPDLWPAWNSLGSGLAESGDSPAAEQAFRTALRINPDAAEAEANLATLIAAKGDLGEAVYLFQRSLRRRPESALAHANYGVALAHMNRAADARRELETAVRLAAAGKDAVVHQQATQLLEQMSVKKSRP